MALQFTDTSKAPDVENAEIKTDAEDEIAHELALAGLARFGFDENKDTGPAKDVPPPVVTKKEEVESVQAVEKNTPDVNYSEAYQKWATGKGLQVDKSVLESIKTPQDLERQVAQYYIDRYAPDPLVAELSKRGITLAEYSEQIKPYQEMMGMPARDLYIQNKVASEMEEQVNLGKIKDEDSYRAEFLRKVEELTEQLKGTSDDVLENAVAPLRQAFKQKIEELPATIRTKQEAQQKAREEENKKAYEEDRKEFLRGVNEKLVKGVSLGIPWKSQADMEEFKEFAAQQTEFKEIKVKGKDGRETVVQDIPFLHRIYNDENFQAQLLRFMFALEKGELTDLKNQARLEALSDFGLEPVLHGLNTEANSTGRFAPTHKKQ